ncbi:hypothetical protein MRX96_049372 [Rhipicephalus microplus]
MSKPIPVALTEPKAPERKERAPEPEHEPRVEVTAPRGNTEEVQGGRAHNPQEEEPIKDWSAVLEDSSPSLQGTNDSASVSETESLSGASQLISSKSDDTRQSSSSIEDAPPNTKPAQGTPVGVKHPSGQVAVGRGHRTPTSEPQHQKPSGDPPSTQQDQQPLSPVSRVLKQSRDPNLRNPLNDIFGPFGEDYGMQLDKPDLKRPYQSSESSSEEVGNPPQAGGDGNAAYPGPLRAQASGRVRRRLTRRSPAGRYSYL